MKTRAKLVRYFEPQDYQDIKAQAKARKENLKHLAFVCGYEYKTFHRILTGHSEGTQLCNALLALGYEIKERY